MTTCSSKNNFATFILVAVIVMLPACEKKQLQSLITIADARNNPARFIDTGESGDSVGDILVFDQPLLDGDMKVIGNNSGSCIRTRVGHSFQCQWTLAFGSKAPEIGTIQVAGREYDKGTSVISIVGGTGKFSGITGVMESTNNNDGTFTQALSYTLTD